MLRLLTEPLFYIYFVYGLSFILMAVFLANEIISAPSVPFTSSFWLLVLFGLTHGLTEMIDWARFIGTTLAGYDPPLALDVSQIMLIASFVFLFQFAVDLLSYNSGKKRIIIRSIPMALYAVFIAALAVQGLSEISKIGLYARYSFGFGGSLLSGFALVKLGNTMKAIGNRKLVRGLNVGAFGFICYAVFGGLIIQTILGMPVQLFRAACAVTITIAAYTILDMFKVTYLSFNSPQES